MAEPSAANDENPYRFERTAEGVRMLKGGSPSSILPLGPPEDADLILDAMDEILAREDLGE